MADFTRIVNTEKIRSYLRLLFNIAIVVMVLYITFLITVPLIILGIVYAISSLSVMIPLVKLIGKLNYIAKTYRYDPKSSLTFIQSEIKDLSIMVSNVRSSSESANYNHNDSHDSNAQRAASSNSKKKQRLLAVFKYFEEVLLEEINQK